MASLTLTTADWDLAPDVYDFEVRALDGAHEYATETITVENTASC